MTISERKKQMEAYQGMTQKPDDFESHWNWENLNAAVEIEIQQIPFCNDLAIYEKMTIPSDYGEIHARCIRPTGEGRYPLVLMFHDLHRGIRGWHHMTRFIAQGYAVIALDEEPSNVDWKIHPEKLNLEARYEKALLLAKVACTLPFVNSEKIVTWGEGFGGGLAMVVSAILPQDSKCAALHLMPADFRGMCRNVSEDVLCKMDYVDLVNFAPLMHGKFLMGTALMDQLSPAEGQYACYHRVECDKEHLIYPKYDHERINFFENEMLKFMHDDRT